MRRYKFLSKEEVFNALNKLRSAFLAAKDGEEVDKIIKGVLTHDERMKMGRRIQIAQLLKEGLRYREIAKELKVGLNTVEKVHGLLNKNPSCYELVFAREEKVEKEYKRKAYQKNRRPKTDIQKEKLHRFQEKRRKKIAAIVVFVI